MPGRSGSSAPSVGPPSSASTGPAWSSASPGRDLGGIGIADDLDRAELFGLERGSERVVVADEDDRRPIRVDVRLGDPQHVVGGDGLDRVAVAGELVLREPVDEQARERPGDGPRGLEPEREHAHEEVARRAELGVGDVLLADPVELGQELVRGPGS